MFPKFNAVMWQYPIPDSDCVDSTASDFPNNVPMLSSDVQTADTISELSHPVLPPRSVPTATVGANVSSKSDFLEFVTPKKRKIKALPLELATLSDKDQSLFEFVSTLDTNAKSKHYGTAVEIAKSVYLPDGSKFDLASLTIDQVRCLVKT
jgi:hypothetical protein